MDGFRIALAEVPPEYPSFLYFLLACPYSDTGTHICPAKATPPLDGTKSGGKAATKSQRLLKAEPHDVIRLDMGHVVYLLC